MSLILLLFLTALGVPTAAFITTISNSRADGSELWTTRLEWQEELFQSAKPLEPTRLSRALPVLQRDGVVLIDGSSSSGLSSSFVDPELCANLRLRILNELSSGNSQWGSKQQDSSSTKKKKDTWYVPGTRLRFIEPIDVAFGIERHDLLLPMEGTTSFELVDNDSNSNNNTASDSLNWSKVLPPVLQSAVQQLYQPFLVDAVETMLPRLAGSDDISNNNNQNNEQIEIVEVAALLNCPGSQHQSVHADYRRYYSTTPLMSSDNKNNHNNPNNFESLIHTQARQGKLPPRLVTFVALQDVPTKEHGSTIFVTGTHTGQAHEWIYGTGVTGCCDNINDNNDTDDTNGQTASEAQEALLEYSQQTASGVVTASKVSNGHMLVYDSSVLHWGGPNTVVDNDRAILYFGVARPGAAAALSTREEQEQSQAMGLQAVPPILVQNVVEAAKGKIAVAAET